MKKKKCPLPLETIQKQLWHDDDKIITLKIDKYLRENKSIIIELN